MKKSYLRRDFLVTASAGFASVGLWSLIPSVGMALPYRSRRPISTFLPDRIDPADLRQLATTAVDAARAAGASYADIRVAERRMLVMLLMVGNVPFSSVGFDCSYGIRVHVDGVWAFGYGADPSVDGVTQTVRDAVTTARDVARTTGETGRARAAMAPVPLVTGEWHAPVQIDPFAISPDDHATLLGAYRTAVRRVPGADASPLFSWAMETRIFASTEGSLTTQSFAHAMPRMRVSAISPFDGDETTVIIDELRPASAGFEIAIGPTLQERMKAIAEETVRLQAVPDGTLDVGRYAAVLDGTSVASVLGATLLPALELERLLGYDADAAGTSFLAPFETTLGQPIFSPRLTLTTDRTAPQYGAAQWDDEGVATAPITVIRHGTVVNGFGTRTTLPLMATPSTTSSATPLTLAGTAIAWTAMRAPMGTAMTTTMAHDPDPQMSLDALVKRIGNGILIRSATAVPTDQQLMGATLGLSRPPLVFEVKQGSIARRIRGMNVAIPSRQFWKELDAIGSHATVQAAIADGVRGQPWSATSQVITAPAVQVRALNVTRQIRRLG